MNGMNRGFAGLPLLWAVTGLFALRVLAQLAQSVAPVGWLPPFDDWHSGIIPYGMLLTVQLMILTGMVFGNLRANRFVPRPLMGTILEVLAALYFLAMVGRLILGLAGVEGFFAKPLPTSFHLMLACYLAVLGASFQSDSNLSIRAVAMLRHAGYPALMALTVACFAYATAHGLAPVLASWLAAALGGVMILTLEVLLPWNPGWRPEGLELRDDILFLSLVQLVLPAILKLAVVSGIVLVAENGQAGVLAYLWPGTWPVAAQIVLMLLLAELARYWLHRAAHATDLLWHFHAVHHAPQKLNMINVGRFHPIEKMLQFAVEGLPFLLLGIAPEAVALYFVIYAVNGFFQHSNADVRLGPLNLLIAGPELHRRHHEFGIAAGPVNLGNTLIIWDRLFGTCAPPSRDTAPIGNGIADYPERFAGQLLAPFRSRRNNQTAS